MGALLNMPLCLLCKLYGLVEKTICIYCLSPSKCSKKKYFDILFLNVCIFSFFFNLFNNNLYLCFFFNLHVDSYNLLVVLYKLN